jgi:hypothetical protein
LLSRNGVIALVAAISPYREVREEVRRRSGPFVEVYVHCPIEVLAERDVKGSTRRLSQARFRASPASLTRTSRRQPEITIDSSKEAVDDSVEKVWTKLREHGADRVIDLIPTRTNRTGRTRQRNWLPRRPRWDSTRWRSRTTTRWPAMTWRAHSPTMRDCG